MPGIRGGRFRGKGPHGRDENTEEKPCIVMRRYSERLPNKERGGIIHYNFITKIL